MSRTKKLICIVLMLNSLFIAGGHCLYAKAEDTADEIIIFKEEKGILLTGSPTTFSFQVEKAGSYQMGMEYINAEENNVNPQIHIALEAPNKISEGGYFDLPLSFQYRYKGERFPVDRYGNELIPEQSAASEWQSKKFDSIQGGTQNGEALNLSEGSYKLKLAAIRGLVKVRKIVLIKPQAIPSYEKYFSSHVKAGAEDTQSVMVTREAELFTTKSHRDIAVSFDRSSQNISPNHPTQIRYNLLGGSGYSSEGQWVEWTFPVEQSGFYHIDFVYRQNINKGFNSCRKIYIDGKVLFDELSCVFFPYTEKFTRLTLYDPEKKPAKIFLDKGEHTIKLEVALKGWKAEISQSEEIVNNLNRLYTKIMLIIGETPDVYRDYDLEKNIPELQTVFSESAHDLKAIADRLDENNWGTGNNTAMLRDVARSLESLAKEPRAIPKRRDNLRSQINMLSDIIGYMRSQPLELDYFTVYSPDQMPEYHKYGFWAQIKFRFLSFIDTFVKDYSNIVAGAADKPIEVWISANDMAAGGYGTGRDQAQIIERLVQDDFTAKTNISANVSLINASSTLLPAIVSGKGPDVAVFVPKATVANLYFRNALTALDDFGGFRDVEQRFYPSSLISLRTNGKTYGLPDIQVFNMMFYRTDIFKEHGLTPPDTWKEFYELLAKLQKLGMQAGISESVTTYEMFLLQNNGELYSQDMTKTRMTEQASINAFTAWTDLYVKYGLLKNFDALNRFRTGQIPLIVASVNLYSQLMLAATEIKGCWEMLPIPGMEIDGKINRSQSGVINASILLAKSKRQADSYRFLDWWTSTDVQIQFGVQSESRMGISARYFSANKKANLAVAWTNKEADALFEQWEHVGDIPQSPAAYFVTRNLTNAFRRVAYSYENPVDVIYRYGRMVDNELTRKRKELGLEAAG